MPSPLYSLRYSSIWLLSSWLSLIGMRILPHGEVKRARKQAGFLSLDAEVADLAEVEQPLVEARPQIHVAAPDVVGQVIDAQSARAGGGAAARRTDTKSTS